MRHIIDGLGWFEFVQFASFGTGRSFGMRSALSKYGTDEPDVTTINSEATGTSVECLIDLMETLAIDRSDVSWLADEFADVALPEWVVFRQDDNGVRAKVGVFSGYRKARAVMAQLEYEAAAQQTDCSHSARAERTHGSSVSR